MAVVHNKTQQRTLAVLRQLLRTVRATVDSRSAADPAVRDVSSWQAHLLGEYRRSARVTNRAELKALRATAEDTLAYLGALGEHRGLLERYRGGDPDSDKLRRSAARYVGLEMPAGGPPLPASAGPAAVAAKYAAPLASRAAEPVGGAAGGGGSAASGLTGVDHLKAQLYGADWREERAPAAGTGAYVPPSPASAPHGGGGAGGADGAPGRGR